MCGKVCLRFLIIAWPNQQIFENKKFVDNTQQCFAFKLQTIFPDHNWNFSLKVKVMRSNPGYLLIFFLLYVEILRVPVSDLVRFFKDVAKMKIST